VNEKVVVVEDDPSILQGLQLNLVMEGYLVRSATGSHAAGAEHSVRIDRLTGEWRLWR
jgi:DNA-binding response OmpR family regulator